MRYSEQMCPRFQRAAELLGKRWTAVILKVLMDGPHRFNEIVDQIEVVSDRMLVDRLKELEAEGVVERRVYAEMPVRVEYSLTDKGRALAPVIEAIAQWSHGWIEPVEAG